jgi:uncharacterized MAPEG superfamily protein
MPDDVMYLVASAILTWIMLLMASLIRAKAWTMPGTLLALGNRDAMPEASVTAGRAERAARNMLENFVLFIAVFVAVHAANRTGPMIDLGAAIFFWARLAYWPTYLLGIVYLRTALWTAGIVGMGIMLSTLFTA